MGRRPAWQEPTSSGPGACGWADVNQTRKLVELRNMSNAIVYSSSNIFKGHINQYSYPIVHWLPDLRLQVQVTSKATSTATASPVQTPRSKQASCLAVACFDIFLTAESFHWAAWFSSGEFSTDSYEQDVPSVTWPENEPGSCFEWKKPVVLPGVFHRQKFVEASWGCSRWKPATKPQLAAIPSAISCPFAFGSQVVPVSSVQWTTWECQWRKASLPVLLPLRYTLGSANTWLGYRKIKSSLLRCVSPCYAAWVEGPTGSSIWGPWSDLPWLRCRESKWVAMHCEGTQRKVQKGTNDDVVSMSLMSGL